MSQGRQTNSQTDRSRFYSCLSCWHRLVSELSLLGWAKIAPALIEMMQGERAQRLRCDTLQARFITLKERYEKYILDQGLEESGYPPFGDIIANKMFQAVIWDTPFDEAVTDDAFDEGFTKMQEFIEGWIEQKTQELLRIVRETSPDVTKDSLQYASTVLYCPICDEYLWYPGVFNHPCQSQHAYWPSPDPDFNPYHRFGAPWNKNLSSYQRLIFLSKASQIMKMILQVCGLPIGATIGDLDSLNPLFECKTCTDDPYHSMAGRVFLRWAQVVCALDFLIPAVFTNFLISLPMEHEIGRPILSLLIYARNTNRKFWPKRGLFALGT